MDDVLSSGTESTASETVLAENEVLEVTEETVVETDSGDATQQEADVTLTETYSSELPEAWLEISDYGKIAVSSIPIGALAGAIFMIVGLGVWVIVKIFKKV